MRVVVVYGYRYKVINLYANEKKIYTYNDVNICCVVITVTACV